MSASKFRKKPVVIEAVQYKTGLNAGEVLEFADGSAFMAASHEVYIETKEGRMHISHNDWVIKGVQGEFYPCKPDIFEATYEPVEQSMTPAMMDDMIDGEG